MPIRKSFKVTSTKHGWTHDAFYLTLPANHAETALVEARYGTEERVYDRAASQHLVDVARGMRECDSVEKAQKYAEEWCNDGRKGSQKKVVDLTAPDAPEFSPENIEFLRTQGVIVITDD